MGHLYAQGKKWVGRGVCSFDFLLFAKVRSARPVSLFLCVTRDLSISKCRAAQATRCAQLLDKFLTAAADKQSGPCSHRLSCVQAAQLKQMWVGFKLSSPVFSPYILPLPKLELVVSSTDLGRWLVKYVGDLLIDGVFV